MDTAHIRSPNAHQRDALFGFMSFLDIWMEFINIHRNLVLSSKIASLSAV